MRHKELRLGSITLLFTVVVLCVAALCALTVATAHADEAVAGKYADQVEAYYVAERAGQEWLSQVDAAIAQKGARLSQSDLPEGTALQDGKISAALEPGNSRRLTVELELTDGAQGRYRILCWENAEIWQEEKDLGNLWNGQLDQTL
jgi:hypothetical protein